MLPSFHLTSKVWTSADADTTMKGLLIALAFVVFITPVFAETSVLRSLPTDVQKRIAEVRANCSGKTITKGDEGLKRFTFNAAPAVLVDTYCGTGDTHSVEMYLRTNKIFSSWASGPIRLNTDHGTFKSIDLKVFAGDHGCPESDRPRVMCDAVVRWNGKAFTYNLSSTADGIPDVFIGRWCRAYSLKCENDLVVSRQSAMSQGDDTMSCEVRRVKKTPLHNAYSIDFDCGYEGDIEKEKQLWVLDGERLMIPNGVYKRVK